MTTKAQAQRLGNISFLIQEITKQIDKQEVPIKNDWIFWCMNTLNVSRRTATEYTEIAFYRLEIK